MTSASTPCPTCAAPVSPDMLIPVGDTRVCPHCRDLYLQRMKEGVPARGDGSDVRAFREQYLKHEASVRSVGILYWIGAVFLMISGISMLFITVGANESSSSVFMAVLAVVYVALAILMVFLGRGLRRLSRWVRIPATLLAVLGLLNFPVGTLINGYILYLIWSEKGKTVFSPAYADAVAATPDMKYKTPLVAKVILFLLVFAIVGILVAVALPSIAG